MKLDRRGFFRVGAGAAVAAPVAAKQVAGEILGGAVHGAPIGNARYLGGAAQAAEPGADWVRQELTEATARMTGFGKPKPQHQRYLDPIIAQRIDGLRSVSAVHKAWMMTEERERLEAMREKGWLQERIDFLKEKLGPLGQLF